MTDHSSGIREYPVFIAGNTADLFAIVTEPVDSAVSSGVIMIIGGSWTTATHRNRMYTESARRLAGQGIRCLRLDYEGTGESAGVTDVFDLQDPLVSNVVAAGEWLEQNGTGSIAIIGTCYGARTALAAAPLLDSVTAVALMTPPLEDYPILHRSIWWHVRQAFRLNTLKAMTHPATRMMYRKAAGRVIKRTVLRRSADDGTKQKVSSQLMSELTTALRQEVRILLVFGGRDVDGVAFKKAQDGPLGTLLADHSKQVQVDMIEGLELHGSTTVRAQETNMNAFESWLLSSRSPRPPTQRIE